MRIDRATRAQMPLGGTLFAYAAAASFFAADGRRDLFAIWAASVAQISLGAAPVGGGAVAAIIADMSALFVMAFGAAGLVVLVRFVIDLAVAFMSRTLRR